MKKIIVWSIAVIFLGSSYGYAGEYLDSAHGTHVKRLNAYTDGHCGHCHEQHASVDGTEPSPTGGPNNYLLFDTSHTSQTANFCFDCHIDSGSEQSGGELKNYSYTYRAGNYNDSASNDNIKQAFDLQSSHNLDNIAIFIKNKWGYTADSNPCCGCHNPHAAQGDPAGSTSAKSSSTRGDPVSMPSSHSPLNLWGLWGDEAGEKMSDYSGYYQAPYRNGSTTVYEPDGSSTKNGSNLTDYVTFCQDCHSSDMTAAPYSLSHTPVDWSTPGGDVLTAGDKHGKNVATVDVTLKAPYASEWGLANGLVLACTDCHEPHGSSSDMTIRGEVNGATVPDITIGDNRDLEPLCQKCHDQDPFFYHHQDSNPDGPYPSTATMTNDDCKVCHLNGAPNTGGPEEICSNCHFHGGDDSWMNDTYETLRRTF